MDEVFVSENGNDSTGDGTMEYPYKTIEKALSVYPSGVSINLLGGTFEARLSNETQVVQFIGSNATILQHLSWKSESPSSSLNIVVKDIRFMDTSNRFPLISLIGRVLNATFENVQISANVPASNETIAIDINSNSSSPIGSIHFINTTFSNSELSLANIKFSNLESLIFTRSQMIGAIGPVTIQNFKYLFFDQSKFTFNKYNRAPSTLGLIRITAGNAIGSNFTTYEHSRLDVYNVHKSFHFFNTYRKSLYATGMMEKSQCLPGKFDTALYENKFYDSHLEWTRHSQVMLKSQAESSQNHMDSYTESQISEINAESNLDSDELHDRAVPCNPSLFTITIKFNSFYGECAAQSSVPLDFTFNYWGHPSGPKICSNPGGTGATIGKMMDFSYWCTTPQCTETVDYPRLLAQTVADGCPSPTPGSIAAFIISYLLFVLIVIVMLVVYCLRCTPRKTDELGVISWYASVSSAMSAISALLLIILSLSGLIGSSACPTRIYAPKCPFTLTDRVVSAGSLLFGGIMFLTSGVATFIVHTKLSEQRPMLYTIMVFEAASMILGVFIGAYSLTNLSSPLRGPYLHLLIVPAAGYLIFCAIQLYHHFNLRKFCRHTILAMDYSDYRSEKRGLLSPAPPKPEESDSESSMEQKPIDEYTITALEPIKVFYSDYAKITDNLLKVEFGLTLLLLSFSIYYTVVSYKGAGGLMIATSILEIFRAGTGIFLCANRGPLSVFKYYQFANGITKLLLLGLLVFIFVQIFTLSPVVIVYFTATLMTPLFFIATITSFRMFKQFVVLEQKVGSY